MLTIVTEGLVKGGTHSVIAHVLAHAVACYPPLAGEQSSDRHARRRLVCMLQEMARKGASRQVAGFVSTFTGLADPYLHGVMADLFASEEENSYTPEWCRVGTILIIDLPVSEYGEVGRMAQILMKKVFIDELLRRQGLEPGEVPCFLVCDE
jgi:hypothetical protein